MPPTAEGEELPAAAGEPDAAALDAAGLDALLELLEDEQAASPVTASAAIPATAVRRETRVMETS
jgi:hypothetical protein